MPEEHVQRLLAVSLKHLAWGCNRLSAHLKLEGVSISGPIIQRILTKNGLRTRCDRWLRLEAKADEQGFALSEEQLKFLEGHNPQVKERHVESSRPGELLRHQGWRVNHKLTYRICHEENLQVRTKT
jgi:hypothetical protein